MITTMRTRPGSLAVAVLLTACGPSDTSAPAPAPAAKVPTTAPVVTDAKRPPAPPPIGDAPLQHGKPSLAALGQAVVDALGASDREALWALAVSEAEYTRLFGALVSHPNMLRLGPTLAWASQREDNRDAVGSALREHGGKGYAFVSLEPTRTEERGGLVIYRNPTLTVKDAAGATLEAKVIGVVVEHVATHTFLVLTYAD